MGVGKARQGAGVAQLCPGWGRLSVLVSPLSQSTLLAAPGGKKHHPEQIFPGSALFPRCGLLLEYPTYPTLKVNFFFVI